MSEGVVHFLTPTPSHRKLGLSCLSVGGKETRDRCGWRALPCYGAVLVLEGRGELEVEQAQRRHEIVAPALFWLFPGVHHRYGPDGSGWREMWTLFEGPAVDGYEELGYLSRAAPVATLEEVWPVRRPLDGLLAMCRERGPRMEAEAAHLVHDLILASRRVQDDPQESSDAAVLNAVREAACRSASVADHARQQGVSISTLRRIVHRGAGCTPKEYILRARLNRAMELLANSELRIAEVGRRVGVNDPAYFSRMFIQRAGISPRRFRYQQRRW